MSRRLWVLVVIVFLAGAGAMAVAALSKPKSHPVQIEAGEGVRLPTPRYDGPLSVEQALSRRRSVREYRDEPLTLEEVSQLLWAAQGVTEAATGFRTAPSAGALYPLEVYVVAGHVVALPAGVYRYRPADHTLIQVMDGDRRAELCEAALRQPPVRDAPLVLVFTAVYERTTGKYGERGVRYVHIEVGHAAQNVFLQAVALDLGAVVIGAFYDDRVKQALNLPAQEEPLYLMPVGKKKPGNR